MRVHAIHTAFAMVDATSQLFNEIIPEVKLNHLVDDSLIQEVIAEGGVTENIKRRLIRYYNAVAESGADIIFNTCSSVGEVAEYAQSICSIPIIKIDDAMAEIAVQSGNRIGVLATLPTTLAPTINLLKRKSMLAGKTIEVIDGLATGAFQAIISGNKDLHDELILEAAKHIANQCDVIVLAQGSMARMEVALTQTTGKIVLSSPRLGVLSIKKFIDTNI